MHFEIVYAAVMHISDAIKVVQSLAISDCRAISGCPFGAAKPILLLNRIDTNINQFVRRKALMTDKTFVSVFICISNPYKRPSRLIEY